MFLLHSPSAPLLTTPYFSLSKVKVVFVLPSMNNSCISINNVAVMIINAAPKWSLNYVVYLKM